MRTALIILFALLLGGCTIGPITKHEFIIVRTGNPIEVLQNVKVRGRRLGDDGLATIDIGGWVAMPREHFEALKRAAEKKDE